MERIRSVKRMGSKGKAKSGLANLQRGNPALVSARLEFFVCFRRGLLRYIATQLAYGCPVMFSCVSQPTSSSPSATGSAACGSSVLQQTGDSIRTINEHSETAREELGDPVLLLVTSGEYGDETQGETVTTGEEECETGDDLVKRGKRCRVCIGDSSDKRKMLYSEILHSKIFEQSFMSV
eukprot:scpid102583/ scgid25919/ 